MPIENELSKVLIIGSGPTIIGSVAEMDTLVTDAIDAFTQEGIQVVIVNPNPATISTDKRSGVTVYMEPMTLPFMKRILRMEEPDAIMPAFGATNALKIMFSLFQDGIIQAMHIRLLGFNQQIQAIGDPEKRSAFLRKLKIPVGQTWYLSSKNGIIGEQLDALMPDLHFPILVKKANQFSKTEHYHFQDESSLRKYFRLESQSDNFSAHDYRLIEDLSTWEEITCNVIRDQDGNCVFVNFVSSMEPVQINAGDSTEVMPALSLNNDQIQRIKAMVRKIVNQLNLTGIMSMHFAVKHTGTKFEAKLLTMRPWLTKSAIWAQKAMLYNVGYVLSKVVLGYRLNEIIDPESGMNAAIEPVTDTISVRMPFWSLTESGQNHYHLNGQMQASGEALGLGHNFESAFMKALFSTHDLKLARQIFKQNEDKSLAQLMAELRQPDDQHWLKLIVALVKGISLEHLQEITHLHPVYLQKLVSIVRIGQMLLKVRESHQIADNLLRRAKERGFSTELISLLTKLPPATIAKQEATTGLVPAYIQLDGTAGYYQPKVNAFYSAYGVQNEAEPLRAQKKILIVGMLPLQVSLTSEFDYMVAHSIQTLHNNGYATVMISNNDEAISNRYRNLDRIYVEPITVENILQIAQHEGIKEVMLQFSGKQVIRLAHALAQSGLSIIGGNNGMKYRMHQLLDHPLAGLEHVPSTVTQETADVEGFVTRYGFPVLIGGISSGIKQKSAVVYDKPALEQYLTQHTWDQITVSRFIEGEKYEVTGITDGQKVTIPGIIEHLEQTGSHASDSIAVFPPQNLLPADRDLMVNSTIDMLKALKSRGIYNLHFLKAHDRIYLLQIKPFAGHNVAFLSQAAGKDITQTATEVLIGKQLSDLGFKEKLWETNQLIHVKMPVFSYMDYQSDNKFDSKMKSSGSVMGRDAELAKALYKGYEASDLPIPSYGTIFISVRDQDKQKVTQLARRFHQLGFKIVATEGTANMFAEAGITTGVVAKIHDNPRNLLEKLRQHKIVMVINITNLSDVASQDATAIRDQALKTHIPVCSTIETAELVIEVLESLALTTLPM